MHVEDGEGRRLAKARLPEGVEGVARFHQLVEPFVEDPAEVVIATGTDRGLFVGALVAAGYTVLAVNPMSTSRNRERHSTSGAKFDPGDVAGRDALALLAVAPTPVLGRGLSRSKIAAALRRGGRQRRVDERTAEIQAALRTDQLAAPDVVSETMGATVTALVAVIAELNAQIARLEDSLADRFEKHPAAKVIRSLPGLGMILGARVLGEFGDDPNRYADAKSRKNYAATSPITKASGKHRVVLARYARKPAAGRRLLPVGLRRPHRQPWRSRLHDEGRTAGTPTTGPYERWPTASSASSTAAFITASSTTRAPPGGTGSNKPLDKYGPWDV